MSPLRLKLLGLLNLVFQITGLMLNIFSPHIYLVLEILKVKITDVPFSPIIGKGRIRISNSTLHIPKSSCNLLSISPLTKYSGCSVEFFFHHLVYFSTYHWKKRLAVLKSERLSYFEEANVSKQCQIVNCELWIYICF